MAQFHNGREIPEAPVWSSVPANTTARAYPRIVSHLDRFQVTIVSQAASSWWAKLWIADLTAACSPFSTVQLQWLLRI
jgi:hypothetical protein